MAKPLATSSDHVHVTPCVIQPIDNAFQGALVAVLDVTREYHCQSAPLHYWLGERRFTNHICPIWHRWHTSHPTRRSREVQPVPLHQRIGSMPRHARKQNPPRMCRWGLRSSIWIMASGTKLRNHKYCCPCSHPSKVLVPHAVAFSASGRRASSTCLQICKTLMSSVWIIPCKTHPPSMKYPPFSLGRPQCPRDHCTCEARHLSKTCWTCILTSISRSLYKSQSRKAWGFDPVCTDKCSPRLSERTWRRI